MSGDDYYSLLGVERSASGAELRKAYLKLALRLHPDKGGDAAQFQAVQNAYSVLKEPEQRARRYLPGASLGGPLFSGLASGA